MIHIATVHWQNAVWIDIQLAYFDKYLPPNSFRVHAFLNGIDPQPYKEKIHYISTEPIQPHVDKLNLLGARICDQADPDDIIYFIDGDAFPVGDIHTFVQEQLKKVKLVAVQRLENDGDPQPHPCFCATTVKFWQEIKGDWGQGPQWKTRGGKLRTDTGGLLWDTLRKNSIDWVPMHRSNTYNLHPLWFGVYSDLIYHHGAAFRTPYCMIDIRKARETWWKRWLMKIADSKLGTWKGGWGQNAVYSFVMKKDIQQMNDSSRELLSEMQTDFEFTRVFKKSPDFAA